MDIPPDSMGSFDASTLSSIIIESLRYTHATQCRSGFGRSGTRLAGPWPRSPGKSRRADHHGPVTGSLFMCLQGGRTLPAGVYPRHGVILYRPRFTDIRKALP